MRAWAGLAAGLLLAACAFWSERPLFGEEDGALPFDDGARFIWRENGNDEAAQEVVYHRAGRRYDVTPSAGGERPMRVMFVDVPETAEEDYIAQVALPSEESVRLYAFMWRAEGGYRIIAAPRAFAGGSPGRRMMDRVCVTQRNGECQLGSRQKLMELYLNAVYPAFVVGDETPEDFMDQLPIDAGAEEK